MPDEPPDLLCRYARDRHRDIARWRNLWTILTFAFGSMSLLALFLAAVGLFGQNWAAGVTAALTAVVNGAAVGWVVTRRTEAVREETEAYQEVVARCGPALAASSLPLPPPASSADPFPQWKLFGLIR